MAATKAGPCSRIPSSHFGYAGGSSLKAPTPAITATSIPTAPKSQLTFNSSRNLCKVCWGELKIAAAVKDYNM